MFNFSEWLISGILSGFHSGEFSFAKVTELTAAYVSKGFISNENAQKIIAETMPQENEEEVQNG